MSNITFQDLTEFRDELAKEKAYLEDERVQKIEEAKLDANSYAENLKKEYENKVAAYRQEKLEAVEVDYALSKTKLDAKIEVVDTMIQKASETDYLG